MLSANIHRVVLVIQNRSYKFWRNAKAQQILLPILVPSAKIKLKRKQLVLSVQQRLEGGEVSRAIKAIRRLVEFSSIASAAKHDDISRHKATAKFLGNVVVHLQVVRRTTIEANIRKQFKKPLLR
jgi:hypothetical protein